MLSLNVLSQFFDTRSFALPHWRHTPEKDQPNCLLTPGPEYWMLRVLARRHVCSRARKRNSSTTKALVTGLLPQGPAQRGTRRNSGAAPPLFRTTTKCSVTAPCVAREGRFHGRIPNQRSCPCPGLRAPSREGSPRIVAPHRVARVRVTPFGLPARFRREFSCWPRRRGRHIRPVNVRGGVCLSPQYPPLESSNDHVRRPTQ
jgi:hypothetical protein